ncbi:expressed protein [Arabidopsis lyrata subsp. lyrata]|uniref:Expressed protein n=1 Tax=Arabidopsis lyrata subsp. lyrata TaxID=81972 RepID=D7LMR3_ARALL|nr:expressed protein [Arabidopsis lyrata subsp. lyrata]
MSRRINTSIVLVAGTVAVTNQAHIDHELGRDVAGDGEAANGGGILWAER